MKTFKWGTKVRITESKLRQIIRRVIKESDGDVMGDAQRVVMNLSSHPILKELINKRMIARMMNTSMVYNLIRDEVESQCGSHGDDHCRAVQKMVETLLRQS